MCEKRRDAGRGNILQGLAQGCTLSPNQFKAYINDMIVAIAEAKQEVTVGEGTVSGLMFADDFAGISETPKDCRNN